MFSSENFINAIFSDQEKTTVEVFYKHVDGSTQTQHVDINGENNPDIKKLLDIVDLEQIEMDTIDLKRREREAYEQEVLRIAKNEGLIPETSIEVSKDSNYISLDSLVFEWDESSEKHKEALFQLKLKIFDIEHVQESEKKAAKTTLRKAQTPLDALVAYSKF